MPERVGATRSFRYLAAVLLLLLFGAGCAPDPGSVAAQANAGDRKGYVSGDGAVDLQRVWTDLQAAGAPVQFMGIDFREEPERGAAFVKKAGVTYPSLSDESGVLILALQGKAPTVPTTLVLDTLGRIAARVNGPASATTLRALVDDVVAES